MKNVRNIEYSTILYVGSERQPIVTTFDTGSCNPWILTKEAIENDPTTRNGTDKHVKGFDYKASTTFKKDIRNEPIGIGFGTGHLRGKFCSDNIVVGNPEDHEHSIELEDFVFPLAFSSMDMQGSFEALVGLAYPQFCHPGITGIFDALMQKQVLHKNIYSFYLSENIMNRQSSCLAM